MFPDLSLNEWIIVIVSALVTHVALLVSSRWVNAVFLIAAAYFILAPLSVAQDFAFVALAKYGRVYVTLLLLLVGFFVLRVHRLRGTAIVFLLYVGVYVFSGLWSDLPVDALKYKGLYGLAVLSGFVLAYSVRSFRDLELGLRVLLVAGAIFGAFIMLEFMRNPTAIFHRERLSFWGMSANRIGQTLAPMLMVCAYLALYASVKPWKIAGYVVGTVLGVLIMYTGSRGAAGEALLGCFVISIPLIRRPALLVVVAVIVGTTVLFTLSRAQTEAPERLLSVNLESREDVWAYAMDEFRDAPLFGHGWVYYIGSQGPSSRNMHSIYFQTLVEAGLFGFVIMGIAVVYAGFSGLRMFRIVRWCGIETQTAYLALGVALAILAHGVIEAGTVRGSTLNGVMLPFALGLFDRIPELLRQLGGGEYPDGSGEPDASDELETAMIEHDGADGEMGEYPPSEL